MIDWKEHSVRRAAVPFLCAVTGTCCVSCTSENGGGSDPQATVPAPPPPLQAPIEATVLFDGTHLNAWRDSSSGESSTAAVDARWLISGDRSAAPSGGDVVTRESFGGYLLHLDFMFPKNPSATALRPRADAEVLLNGTYAIRIADSYGRPLSENSCGAIVGATEPSVDAASPAGRWQTLEIAFEQPRDEPPLISVWLNGEQVQRDVRVIRADGDGDSPPAYPLDAFFVADDDVALGADNVTVLARFRAEGEGTIFARAPATGEWKPDAKAVFFRGDQLIYDIGWVGAISAGSGYNDGTWHTLAWVYRDRVIHLYVDGELKATRENFISEDKPDHVFKIGAASSDFGGSFEGDVSRVLVYEGALPETEIEAFARDVLPGAQAVLDWTGPQSRIRPRADFDSAGVTGPIQLRVGGSPVRFANIWLRPLPDVDHAHLVTSVTEAGIARGRRIYNRLCVTCHGSKDQPGTLPTSRRLHEQPLEAGTDPYGMFKTLSRGYKQMLPQTWMNAQQKYDVIHYIREVILKQDNPQQYFEITDEYLASLPKGRSRLVEERAADQNPLDQYLRMDFGPSLHWTLQVAPDNIAYKGIAIRLDDGAGGVAQGNTWVLYDHDTMRMAAMWEGEFVDWRGIAFDGSHQTHTSIAGSPVFTNPVGPGWARPGTVEFDDDRFIGRDGKPYGPLPRDWLRYRGTYQHGQRVVLSYTVGTTEILEMPELVGAGVLARNFDISDPTEELALRIGPAASGVALSEGAVGMIEERDGFHVLVIPADSGPQSFRVFIGNQKSGIIDQIKLVAGAAPDLRALIGGGPRRWPEVLGVAGQLDVGDDWDESPGEAAPYDIDSLVVPRDNPWGSWMRLGGFDFFPGGQRAAVCTWNGDVWLVDGIDDDLELVTWQRVATGLFQPLGVKIVDDSIYVTCRDQIVKLHDLNGDEEIDFYECFNNDHQVTEHFHEFAMGLETDAEGDFYYAKSARHALPALVEHHGTLLKVAADGSHTEVVANGFRAANGVCVNDDGSFFVTDQEGHWTPKNRINWVTPGKFYGNYMGYHDRGADDSEMEQPLVWLTNEFDRSPAELLWATSDRWGPLKGALLAVSYGMGQVFVVPHERVNGQVQGGQAPLPLALFPTGVMRGRFNDDDGQLYVCGLYAWAGNRVEPGGFYRVRYTGGEVLVPVDIRARESTLDLTFSSQLDSSFVQDPERYEIRVWDLRRTSNYGSPHINERSLSIAAASLLDDKRTIRLRVPDLGPTWGMKCEFTVRSATGLEVTSEIHNTIHHIAPEGDESF